MSRASGPFISESYLDAPSQRLYALSLGLLCQAIKAFDVFQYFVSSGPSSYVRKWVFVDAAYVLALAQLRIPRLNYSKAVVMLQLCLLSGLDAVLFGGVSFNLDAPTIPSLRSELHGLPSTESISQKALSWVGLSSSSSAHLAGAHTVRMSPISTAQLNPEGISVCVTPDSPVLIPVLLNNTSPTSLRYSLTPLSDDQEPELFDLSTRDLRQASSAVARPTSSAVVDDEYDDEGDGDDLRDTPSLQKTQSLAQLQITKPGILRLERVVHSSSITSRIAGRRTMTIAPCPGATFVDEVKEELPIRCANERKDLDMQIRIHGVAPLTLRWSKNAPDGKVQDFHVENIGHGSKVPNSLVVPLSVSASSPGVHTYVLESVADALGNFVKLGRRSPESASNTDTTRSVHVLQMPRVSFVGRSCSLSNPARLIIGSDVKLPVHVLDLDPLDGPLHVKTTYEPLADTDFSEGHKAPSWTRELSLQDSRHNAHVFAEHPGRYHIASAQGRYCQAEVLNPDVCDVVVIPKPSAQIEWKPIHECSGDVGVSASLALKGTPPFHVHYRVQRDDGHSREHVKTLHGARGEITEVPEKSGRYSYTFVALSDANYKKVPLDGPSIEGIGVHPLASADFAHRPHSGKYQINSCSGDSVDVEIDLKGTPPFTVELQLQAIDSALATQTITLPEVRTARKAVTVSLPTQGNSFTLDLVNIEDAYGCKRPLSVPGIAIYVRRSKPTVRFYGNTEQRQVTVLQDEKARLPLRLTGEGPWKVKYRKVDAQQALVATITSPNDPLIVDSTGSYELIGVTDSQCPGSVDAQSSTFKVDWTGRPYAKLSSDTRATFVEDTGGYQLDPVCQGSDSHVDLRLSGRAPWQLVYNIARDAPVTGTEIIDVQTFSSIEPRTRFQLLTSQPGMRYYELKQIGDAAYPLSVTHTQIPRASRLLFSQSVLSRPSGEFLRHTKRISYCLNDAFVSRSSQASATLSLSGSPPFEVRMSMKDLAKGETYEYTATITGHTWDLDIPSHVFRSIGPHLVTLESMQDSSGCEQTPLDPSSKAVWVDVAEAAAIVPYDPTKEHFCVGDVTQFQLEGTPPWTISYNINSKRYTKHAALSPFSLAQQVPGEFVIHSIAHQQKLCTTAISDLHYKVHPLPSAEVGHGENLVSDLYEGDQAAITFTLRGTPPFTFTYQRAELGKPNHVVESHTVSGVMEREHTIYSALEGHWTVRSVQDAYCRYPPNRADGSS